MHFLITSMRWRVWHVAGATAVLLGTNPGFGTSPTDHQVLATGEQRISEITLVDFTEFPELESNQWVTIDDGVFFGASDTNWVIMEEEGAEFSGTVSLKRGGGWCTVRRRPSEPIDLTSFVGIKLRVQGDGKTYGFNLRHDDERNGTYYEATFTTKPGEWEEVYLPFGSFEGLHLGRPRRNAEPLKIDSIQSYAFVISHKQEGEFTLKIGSICAYSESPSGETDHPVKLESSEEQQEGRAP